MKISTKEKIERTRRTERKKRAPATLEPSPEPKYNTLNKI